jgi:hypothetical protein
MKKFRYLALAIALAGMAPPAFAERIVAAAFAEPVQRYGHFALGRPHEYARLTASTDNGRRLALALPADEVFEDLTPRIVKLAADEPPSILAIVSQRERGTRLVLLHLNGARLEIAAQSAPTGQPRRWLNPVGVADLDGDGRAEIAAVITPHVGGPLKVYRRQGAELVEMAALEGGFSNHVFGTTELGLSMPFAIGGKTRLLVPDVTRTQLRVVGLENGRLVEIGRCALSSPITGAIRMISAGQVSLGLATGRKPLAPAACPAPSAGR